MRNIKRITASVMAVVMCFSVVGCANDSDSSSTTTTEALPVDVKPETKEVVESLSGFDLSDYVIESAVDADFKLEAEAENATLNGSAGIYSSKFLGDFSGDGFVGGISDENSSVEFTFDFPAKGSYTFTVSSAVDVAGETAILTVDGVKTGTLKITNSDKFTDNLVSMVSVDEGKHTIGITYGSSPAYVDKITVTSGETVDLSQYEVSKQLSNPNASDRTKRLFSFMCDTYGKYIISGNYASETGGIGGIESREFKSIKSVTGEYPAIMGLDLSNLSPSAVEHNATTNTIYYAQEWNAKGGIVTLCWHWYPDDKYLGVYDEKPWFKGFYSDSTNFNLAQALDGTDQYGYDCLIRDIDAIAEALKELEALDIPILWRPLHEAGGDPQWNNPWFWWGSSGSEAYIELWKLLYDRLTNYHKIDNLIWVWNAQNVNWYPGDEYVDMIGYDIYADEQDTTSQKEIYDYIKGSTNTNKIICLSENGVIPDPDACMSDGTRWSWFSVWNGEFTIKDAQLSDQYTPLETWEKVYSHDRVLTLDELPDLTCYPIDTESFLAEQ